MGTWCEKGRIHNTKSLKEFWSIWLMMDSHSYFCIVFVGFSMAMSYF
jgi:hypothetical protein